MRVAAGRHVSHLSRREVGALGRPATRSSRIACVVLIGLLGLALASIGERGNAQEIPAGAVGRLTVDSTRLCTAFLVRSIERRSIVPFGIPRVSYENILVTAGHCFGQRLQFQHDGAWYPVAHVIGFSAPESLGFDLLVATFLTPVPVPTLEPAFGVYPQTGDLLMLIGFGGKALMAQVDPMLGYDARGLLMVNGYASRGTSGAPVLIPGTRRVVGIETETTVDRSADAPFLCVITPCGAHPPYGAVHVDRLRGLINFP